MTQPTRRRATPLRIFMISAFLLLPGVSRAATHDHVSPDGLASAACTCLPATEEERVDPSTSPDGWVQEGGRESFNRGTVPLPLVPDWVGTRNRAAGVLLWGDADGDGDEDLFVGTYYGNMYPPLIDYYNFIYLNAGGMLENEPSWISPDEKHTTDAQWGFLNDDEYPDLFVANGGQSLHPSQVFYGQDGLLPTTPGWTSNDNCWTIGCAFEDFDRDGDTDVATANQGNTQNPYRPTYLFRNLGNGLESVPSWQSAQVGITNDVDWGDMDGDSLPDLAASGWSSWNTGVFRNTGSTLEATFTWTTGHPERTDKGIGWAFVDGDPYLDLAVGGNGGPDWLFRNEGSMLGQSPVWESGEPYHGCQDLAWVDIDRDGDEDLATINFSTGHARIYLNNDGVLSAIADWQYDAASSGTAVAFGDVNDDGWPDLAIGVANGPIELFLNTTIPTGVEQSAASIPRVGDLRVTAGPNPFRDRARIVLEGATLFHPERVEIFDTAGRSVAILRPGDLRPQRVHSVDWIVQESEPRAAGIYFIHASGRDVEGRSLTARSKIVWLGR